MSSSDGQSLTFGPLTSPSRPILYSANLCWLSPEAVLVAGGTVFGEIIVWKYYLDPKLPSPWEKNAIIDPVCRLELFGLGRDTSLDEDL